MQYKKNKKKNSVTLVDYQYVRSVPVHISSTFNLFLEWSRMSHLLWAMRQGTDVRQSGWLSCYLVSKNTYKKLSQNLFRWEFQTALPSYPYSRKLFLDLHQLIGTVCMDRYIDKHPWGNYRNSQVLLLVPKRFLLSQ